MRKVYFIDSIYIPYGTKTACVTMFPVDENREEGDGENLETTTDKLVLAGSKRKRIMEGEYYYYDPNATQPFSDASKDPIAKDMNQRFAELQAELIKRYI